MKSNHITNKKAKKRTKSAAYPCLPNTREPENGSNDNEIEQILRNEMK